MYSRGTIFIRFKINFLKFLFLENKLNISPKFSV
jgi:hypothetical protein